jgi:hypothetical protein
VASEPPTRPKTLYLFKDLVTFWMNAVKIPGSAICAIQINKITENASSVLEMKFSLVLVNAEILDM